MTDLHTALASGAIEQPAQEPLKHWEDGDVFERIAASKPRPQAREPLSEVQIATVYWGATGQSLRPQDNALAYKFARAIEAAHGITGEKNG